MNNGGPNLVLTSPQGDSYYIKTLEAGERVVAIADDGASVVTERESKPGRIHHLASGEVTTVASMGRILGYLPGNASVVGYETDTNDLVTYDAQTGGVAIRSAVGGNQPAVISSPDGLHHAVEEDGQVVILDAGMTSEVPAPKPAGTTHCYAPRWKDAHTVEQTCSGTDRTRTQVYEFTLRSDVPHQVTHGDSPVGYGYAGLMHTSRGTMAMAQSDPNSQDICQRKLWWMKDGEATRPVGLPKDGCFVTSTGDSVFLRTLPTKDSDESITRYGVATGTTTPIAGPGSKTPGGITGSAYIEQR